MKIYNTLSGRKEELVTLNPGQVSMYVCGPTTYNYIHLGNARPLVVFDMVRRYLAFRGYHVHYVQNFTDVDDKIINRAREEGDDPIKLAEHYIHEYFIDADALGINRADIHPRVSEHIPQIIAVIEGLIAKGYAYEVDGDVYFRVKSFPEYGKLSGRSLDDMLAGARVEIDERKEAPVDFALWKQAKPGEPYWGSPWGAGRPGWHIECSVMSTQYLGETFDIHGGGADLIFPHHENEIAQAEAYTGKPFVNYWMHNGFITVNSEKMSKSLGNFFILRDILARFPQDVVRYYLIATHYRSPLDFDDGKLEEARKALGRLKTTMLLAEEFLGGTEFRTTAVVEAELITRGMELQEKFIGAMDDDFNSAKALGYLFELSHQINAFIAGADYNRETDKAILGQAVEIFHNLGGVLGIFMDTKTVGQHRVDDVLSIILDMRDGARQDKNYALADSLRDFLNHHHIKVEDKANGSQVRYEKAPEIDEILNFLSALRQNFKVNKEYERADRLREELKNAGVTLKDTKEGVRWKIVDT